MKKDLKFICQLDGYNYYLGDVVAENVNWYDAQELVKRLGDGWELPSRVVATLAHNKFPEEMSSVDGWYWLGEEFSTSCAFDQYSMYGCQDYDYKTHTTRRYARPIYKEKLYKNSKH